MPKVSVIVPVYNTKVEYLKYCLDCIDRSSISGQDMEVIVVDDGSSVAYSEVKKSFPHFHFYSIENVGTLKARLFGLAKATGDYIAFVDSDDALSFDYLEAMLICAEQTQSDIVINDWAFWTRNSKYVCINDSTIRTNFSLEGKAVLEKFFSSCGAEHSYYVLWNKLYKREILLRTKQDIERLGISKLVFAEDVLTSFFAFSYAQKISNTHSGHYFYRIHDSQQIYISDREKFVNQIESIGKVFNIMESHIERIGREDLSPMLKKWKELMASSNLTTARHSHFHEIKSVILVNYSVEKISRLPTSVQKPYQKHLLLPSNLDEIEDVIRKLFNEKNITKLTVKKSSYAERRLQNMSKLFSLPITIIYDEKRADIISPREIYPLKLRIIHNPLIYKLGMFLFPKGSKIRKLLKAKI